MYRLEDISVIIPTYNRADDLLETLDSFKDSINKIEEVIIVDQSKDDKIKELIAKLKNKKIKYHWLSKPSLTRARNVGVAKSSSRARIVTFLDDDVSLKNDYFYKILEVFNNNKEVVGVGGYYLPEGKTFGKVETKLRRIFLIENLENNCADVLSAYGAIYPSELTKVIQSQWIPGFNMSFKKEIFNDIKFDEKLSRYALGEDFDFTYRLYKKKPRSLFITPYAKLVHRASIVERYPTAKVAYMNQIHHFYFNYKNFNSSFKEKTNFVWCVAGITALRVIQFVKTRDKKDWLKLFYYFKSLSYCLKNIDRIKKGQLDKLSGDFYLS